MVCGWCLVVLVACLLPTFGRGVPTSAKVRPRDVGTVAATAGLIPGLLGDLQTRQSTCSVGYEICSSEILCCPSGGECCESENLRLRPSVCM